MDWGLETVFYFQILRSELYVCKRMSLHVGNTHYLGDNLLSNGSEKNWCVCTCVSLLMHAREERGKNDEVNGTKCQQLVNLDKEVYWSCKLKLHQNENVENIK